MWSSSQLIWTFCFALILVVSILGNGIVLWIILGRYVYDIQIRFQIIKLPLRKNISVLPSIIFVKYLEVKCRSFQK